jgi:hypothetical protein
VRSAAASEAIGVVDERHLARRDDGVQLHEALELARAVDADLLFARVLLPAVRRTDGEQIRMGGGGDLTAAGTLAAGARVDRRRRAGEARDEALREQGLADAGRAGEQQRVW